MSGGNSGSNNWTIVTPEETVAETLRPLAEGTEHHEEPSAADSGASAVGAPVEEHMVLEDKAELIAHTSTEQHTSTPPALSDAPVPTLLEVSCSFVPGSDVSNHPEDVPENPAHTSPDPDSFSDSYTHISPSPDVPPASLLSTETLGGEETTHEEERLVQEGVLHPLQEEKLQQEGAQSDLSPSMTELEKQADCPPVDSEVCEEGTVRTEEQGDPEVRRRRRSLLAALERIGRREEEEDREEEEREEEFQLPQRVDDSGFTINKCILGAVILLGLGTIFFSESDYGTGELKDSEVPGKQEWLNPEVPPLPADADSTELLNKLAKGNQQISVLQAQLQAQKEELKVATEKAAEGAVERLLREEMEKENSRLKTEMESLPLLQKENERMKQELESVPALQKELETLRSTVTELKRSSAAGEAAQAPSQPSTSPLSGQSEDSRKGTTLRQGRKPWSEQKEKKTDWKKEKYDSGEKKEWKERERSGWKEEEKKERKDGGKIEGKKAKHEQAKDEKMKDNEGKQKRHSKESKQLKENEGKKEKMSRGDEGKTWKAREGKKEGVERKDWNEVKDWKKGKYEKSEGKQEKDWKTEKDYGGKHKVREEWKKEKEWKKENNDFKESGKEKWEKKNWEEKGEEKNSDWKGKNGKGKGWKKRGENKQWEESENHSKNYGKERKGKWDENERMSKNGKDVKEWKVKDESNQWVKKEEDWKRGQKKREHNGDREKDGFSSQNHKDERKMSKNHPHDHHGGSVWADQRDPHSHRRPSPEQPEYWVQQREQLRHSPKSPQHCDTLETCAQTEGLLPVHLSEFDTILQNYLAKAEEAGVNGSQREELTKLAAEFFKDGVFLHDQISFEDFVEDVGDILEDMVEGVENEKKVDSTIEEEMDEFEREVMKKFSASGAAKKEERILGEQKKESRRGHG